MSESLIYALSTKGAMKIEQFNDIFKMVYLPSIDQNHKEIDIDSRMQLVRLLDSLGYCEFDYNNRMVYMCPPCLTMLPAYGLPRTVLTGARTPSLLEKVKCAIKKRKDKAAYINISSSIFIEAIDNATIQEIAQEAGIDFRLERPVAWDLVNLSSSLDEIKQSLRLELREEPNWSRRIFLPDKLSFRRREEAIDGDYKLVAYKNPVTQQPQHWLWAGMTTVEIERDWGRYLVLSSNKINILLYDKKVNKLAVPATVPLPTLFARTMAMCTGMSPIFAETGDAKLGGIPPAHPVQIYSGIPLAIAELTAQKLGQQLVPVCLEPGTDGVNYD